MAPVINIQCIPTTVMWVGDQNATPGTTSNLIFTDEGGTYNATANDGTGTKQLTGTE